MSALTIVAEPLDRTAFAPFGDVIEVAASCPHYPINGGSSERYHALTQVHTGPDGQAIINIFRSQPQTLPCSLNLLERHPLGSQAFMPLSGHPYLVVVASGEQPEPGHIRAFLAQPHQGVNYAPGIWHHPLLALDGVSDFLVVDRLGPGLNCEEWSLPWPTLVIKA